MNENSSAIRLHDMDSEILYLTFRQCTYFSQYVFSITLWPFMEPLLPWKCNSGFNLYCWDTLVPVNSMKCLNCCHGNITVHYQYCCILLLTHMSDNSNMYLGLHVKCLVFLYHFNETWSFWTDGSIQFYANPLCGSRVDMCGHTDKCDEAGRCVLWLCKHTDNGLYVQKLRPSVKLPFCDLV